MVRMELSIVAVFLFSCLIITVSAQERRRIFFPGPSRDRTTADNSCTTPDKLPGECKVVSSCPMFKLNQSIAALKRSLCGFEGLVPRVCCQLKVAPADIPSPEDTKPSLRIGGIPSSIPESCGVSEHPSTRIVGGEEADIGAWPWMAAIFFRKGPINMLWCGGVLITKRHVLTAAHCLYNLHRRRTRLPVTQLVVRLGEHDLEREDETPITPIEVAVQSFIQHPDFELSSYSNDIAILKLASDVEFGGLVYPICLPFEKLGSEEDITGRNAFTAGWGATAFEQYDHRSTDLPDEYDFFVEDRGPSSPVLNQVQIRVLKPDLCEKAYNNVKIGETILCAGFEEGGKDACRGDSGGPLMLPEVVSGTVKYYLIGIVSFGKQCAEAGIPGVYTKVSAYTNWIAENLS